MRCPNCFNDANTEKCPECGFDLMNYSENTSALPLFYVLNGKYVIGKVLGQGGFGITYKAKSLDDNKIYAIKEYLPSEYSLRSTDGVTVEPNSQNSEAIYKHAKMRFLEEAKMLDKFHYNPIVVDIFDYFEENNTAYFVMEFLDGMTLKAAVNNMGGKISVDEAKIIFVTIASGLIDIHKANILHRDISPENIFLTKDNNIKLIDFGAARDYIKSQNSGMSVLLKPGFAPPEQYRSNGEQGPWTDVYALAMTFYYVVTGKKPVDAMSRKSGDSMPLLNEVNPLVSLTTSKVMEKAYALDIKKRYRNFESLLNDIDIEYNVEEKRNNQIVNEEDDVVTKKLKVPDTSSNIAKSSREKSFSKIIKKLFFHKNPYIIVNSYGDEKIYRLNNNVLKIGRAEDKCDVVINDEIISRIHCEIRYDRNANSFVVIDSSFNGTFSETERLKKKQEYHFSPGEKIILVNEKNIVSFVLN